MKYFRSLLFIFLFIFIGQITVFAYEEDIKNIEQQIVKLNDVQEKAHLMAQTARGLGIFEEDSIIVKAQEIWLNAYLEKVELEKRLEDYQIKQLSSKVYVGDFKLTGYCPCYSCSSGWGRKTASGVTASEGITIAADTKILPLGTRVYIEGVGERIVQDVGGAIKGNKLDVYVNNHSNVYNSNINQISKVYILKG